MLAATPFQQDVASAFDKLSAALTPGMRQFLDRLPLVIQAKGASPRTGRPEAVKTEREHIAKLLDATLNHRRATMKYFSMSSRREKDYVIEPYRLIYSPGGMYLQAFVPEYGGVRTFSVDRIRGLSLHEERFTPTENRTRRSRIRSASTRARRSTSRSPSSRASRPTSASASGTPSQKHTDRKDGGVVLSLDVCNDWALSSWILGFGPLARVLKPAALAAQIKDEIDRASARYAVMITRADGFPPKSRRHNGTAIWFFFVPSCLL